MKGDQRLLSLILTLSVVIKFCFDGFKVGRFNANEQHFQFGWGVVSVGGDVIADVNSRDNIRP